MQKEYRAGVVTFVGRPNAGKSTLMNALVGEHLAIVSDKPQTTRKTIYGIVNRPHGQIAIVDTPGIHKPRTLLGDRLNRLTQEILSTVDTIAACFPADQKIGPGDRFILERIAEHPHAKKVAVITKTDLVDKTVVAKRLIELDSLVQDWEALVPVSALENFQLQALEEVLLATFSLSPPLFFDQEESLEDKISELIRESALHDLEQELPHSTAVTVEEILLSERGGKDFAQVYVNVYVERESQKAILLGRGGGRMKQIAEASRRKIEAIMGHQIYLSIRVKVAKNWQKDPRFLKRLGF